MIIDLDHKDNKGTCRIKSKSSMSLIAVVMGFSGVIVDDERIHAEAINRLLVEDNLRSLTLSPFQDYRLRYMGRTDADRIRRLWGDQGRVLSPAQLQHLLQRKQTHYIERIGQLTKLPLIPFLVETIERIESLNLKLALVSGISKIETHYLLERAQLMSRFSSIVTQQDLPLDQVDTLGYLHHYFLKTQALLGLNCLGIEATYPGIAAGQAAGIPMLGLCTMAPLHMIQRRANWAVDRLAQIEWDRIQRQLETGIDQPIALDTAVIAKISEAGDNLNSSR